MKVHHHVNPRSAAQSLPLTRKLRILVVDDSPVNQLLAIRLLQTAGHITGAADNGQDALEALWRAPFDLVLMDVQMPVMDGFQATAVIRRCEKATGRHIPIVAVTSHAQPEDRERCLNRGMDDYVTKPIQVADLFAAIARMVPTEKGRQQDADCLSGGGAHTSQGAPLIGAREPADSESLILKIAGTRPGPDPVDSDRTLRRELTETLLYEYPRRLARIREALDQRDAQSLRMSAHALKGSAGVFRDQRAFDAAFRMEQIGAGADWEQSEAAWNLLQGEMNRLAANLAGQVEASSKCERCETEEFVAC
jgi:CheY-like chemotaxis protein/HPt (histidine-containing phosphotransfer) domain-containing protein